MNKIFWNNSTLSGLCDRLIDLSLMSAYAKVQDKNLLLQWNLQSGFTEFQLKTWSKDRFEDYKKENFTKYFNLPSNILFLDENNFDGVELVFHDYLGGVYSTKTFYTKYCDNLCSYEEFKKAHYNTLSEFTPKQALLDIVGTNNVIDISVHLRRGDKVNNNPNFVEISSEHLNSLDSLTKECFIQQINLFKEKPTVFVCSDSAEAKKDFIEEFTERCNFIDRSPINFSYEKTYIDLYLLSISKTIIMSQKHTNFSIFSSLINRNKLIYFFEDNEMIKGGDFLNAKLYRSTKNDTK
jgi:hypothetical protein